jgi:hypothetical protein
MAMRQYVLVAGVDYEFKRVDFRILCDNRRKRIVDSNSTRTDLRFTTIDFRGGETVVTDVTYPGGKKIEKSSRTRTFTTVTRASYTRVTFPDGSTHNRFKPGQWGTASILDVYSTVREIATSTPGTLAELSFFSHGWMGGSILVNSDDDRTALVPVPSVGTAPGIVLLTASGTMRDPDDMDPRPQYDFVAPTMDAAALGLFQKAFAADGFVWLWGCSFPKVVHHVLTAMERSSDYKSTGLADDDVLRLTNLNAEDVAYLEVFLMPLLGPFPAPRSTVTVKFKYLKYFACAANQSSFAARMADASKVPTRAAPLGTYADYDTGKLALMSVYSGFSAHFMFYRNYLGMSFDPEGHRYGVYTPDTSCPMP